MNEACSVIFELGDGSVTRVSALIVAYNQSIRPLITFSTVSVTFWASVTNGRNKNGLCCQGNIRILISKLPCNFPDISWLSNDGLGCRCELIRIKMLFICSDIELVHPPLLHPPHQPPPQPPPLSHPTIGCFSYLVVL